MKRIYVSPGHYALVDDEDYDALVGTSWRLTSVGYAQAAHKGERFHALAYRTGRPIKHPSMHRIIMNAPVELQVDHINGNKIDNRKANLRLVTNQQNSQNRIHPRGGTIVGIRGVTLRRHRPWKVSKPYEARVMVAGKMHTVGYFTTAEEAERAVTRARAALMPYSVADQEAVR